MLIGNAATISLIATADWFIGNKASLGVLYILPMMLCGTVSTPVQTVAVALLCAALRAWFDLPSPPVEVLLRFIFASMAYSGCGMFVIALIGNRRLVVEHLARIRRQEELRQDSEEQLRVLVESSPAGILTVDTQGLVIAANRAAANLFMISANDNLIGRPIGEYIEHA